MLRSQPALTSGHQGQATRLGSNWSQLFAFFLYIKTHSYKPNSPFISALSGRPARRASAQLAAARRAPLVLARIVLLHQRVLRPSGFEPARGPPADALQKVVERPIVEGLPRTPASFQCD